MEGLLKTSGGTAGVSGWDKSRFRYLQGYAQSHTHQFCERLQSGPRLIPGALVQRSKIGLDNRFLS
jgi:hypothetical protein